MTLIEGLGLAASSLMISVLAMLVLGLVGRRCARTGGRTADETRRNHFLFREGRLVDHDAAGWSLPDPAKGAQSDWLRFRAWLAFRFPALPEGVSSSAPGGAPVIESRDGDFRTRVQLESSGQTLRVTMSELAMPGPAALHDHLRRCEGWRLQAQALDLAPDPVLLCDREGSVLWQNAAARRHSQDDLCMMIRAAGPCPASGQRTLAHLSQAGSGHATGTCHDLHVTGTEEGFALHVRDVSRAARAEEIQRAFTQTMTKTFADLTVGLAVFDRDRALALFNPAILDMTGLDPAFLSTRPGLNSFFDALRDRQVMPEPRNYVGWRNQINEIVTTARGGLYQEVWSLASGQTYRVTGRPHPDGDVAFLFEDITLEISNTRRHRLQMDLRQSVLDGLEQGIAVLSREGRLSFCNRALAEQLGIDPDSGFAQAGLREILTACHARFPDASLWPEVERRIVARTPGIPFSRRAGPPGGRQADVRITQLDWGQAMLTLSPHEPALSLARATGPA